LSFSSFSPNLLIRERDDIKSLKRLQYLPLMRRRDGDGIVAEGVVFAGYTIEWKDVEMTGIVATVSMVTDTKLTRQWAEGWNIVTQWHLITSSEDTHAAIDLIHACSSWATTIREAVLVFEDSYWRADHSLWEAVQQVCS
jgi:hypothetical protein